MFILKAVVYSLYLVGVCGSYFDLSGLIQRILKEADTTTVYFMGMDSGFVSGFMKDHAEVSVAILTYLPSGSHDHFNKNDAILVVQTHSENHQNIAMAHHFIRRLRVHKFVIVSADNLDSLQEYFLYFWENKFTRIFGIAENTSYAYLPYADFPLQKLHKFDPIPDALKDLNGFAFRTTVPRYFPITFWYPDKNGRKQIGGSFGKIFLNFVQRHNATFKETLSNNSAGVSVGEIINAVKENKIDISSNGFSEVSDLSSSYPVKISDVLIMVPLNGHVNPNEYFLRPFSPAAWTCIGLTLVYIILMDIMKDICMQSHVNVWHSFSRAWNIMLGSATERPISSAYRFHGQVLLLAFILGNFYVIYFTSFLTVFIKVKQYDTIQDLINNNVRVMCADVMWELQSDTDQHPEGFEKIVHSVDFQIYVRAVDTLNDTSFAYPAYADSAKFLLGLQASSGRPLFHSTRDSIATVQLGFLLPQQSPFKEILDNFIIRIVQTGLVEKWDFEAIMEARKARHEIYIDHSIEPEHAPLTMDHLRFAWICLAMGLILALMVFLAEIFGSTIRRFFILCKRYFLRRSREENVVYLP